MSDNNAAAPKAEPVSDPYKLEPLPLGTPVEVDFKEAEVGRQTLYVAGVVYDKPGMLAPEYWLSETWPVKCRGDVSTDWKRNMFSAQPEAPKVEQEPVGRVVSSHGDPEEFGEREIEVLRDLSGIPYNTPLYTHPTPASDELLEALEGFVSSLTRDGKSRYGELSISHPDLTQLIERARATIAKHKGPQS